MATGNCSIIAVGRHVCSIWPQTKANKQSSHPDTPSGLPNYPPTSMNGIDHSSPRAGGCCQRRFGLRGTRIPTDLTVFGTIRCTFPFSLSGQSVLPVPRGFDAGGIPISLQIAGRPWA